MRENNKAKDREKEREYNELYKIHPKEYFSN